MEMMKMASRIFCLYYSSDFIWCKILTTCVSGFTSPRKEGLLQIFIVLKTPLHRPGLNSRSLGPVADTLIIASPKRKTEIKYVL
jgi:hypothetical protein